MVFSNARLAVDLDGVMADFDFLAEMIFGMPGQEFEDLNGSEAFWEVLEGHGSFFRDLPPMEDAMMLWDAIKHLNPPILTGCPKGGWAEPQKVEWVAEHLGPEVKCITCPARDKFQHMTAPGDILIDDFTKHQHRWEAAGGIFVHHTSARSTIRKLAALGVDVRP